ncbi:hypothetical protein DEO72_LG2g5831 [Vigna unguiculata]|uniref:C2H2-type domain-containing protein n=1 Tax=Vigna unguiculata TaxID=3917 RepID=A0A4D6LA80_VIGUN|nr:hypothetical protein DEO72_LG2g5831 [Vigna unguiculata]
MASLVRIDTLLNNSSLPSSQPFSCAQNATTATNKRKRRPAGTPDPDAEVVSLSPKTLLESDRYVCEICNQGFQRDQNLQMHRRRHKVPWKLLKRETPLVKKRVFVCPEPTCLHHDPCHALGDLVGIKKHFRRKHSSHKQWVCERCSKGYAVQVESFIEHQDACNVGRLGPETQAVQAAAVCLSRTASSPSSENNFSTGAPLQIGVIVPKPPETCTVVEPALFSNTTTAQTNNDSKVNKLQPNLELQLSTASGTGNKSEGNPCAQLQLSIGSLEKGCMREKWLGERVEDEAREQLRMAVAEKAYAEEARKHAKRQMEQAELEFTNAKRIRQQALAELDKACALKDHAIKQINSTMLQITCLACKHHFQTAPSDHTSFVFSYITRDAAQPGKHRLKAIN